MKNELHSVEGSSLGLADDLCSEFDRWLRQVGPDDRHSRFAITATEVLKAHFLLADYFREVGGALGGVGPRSLDLLHSAVSRQYVGYAGRDKWTDLFDIAATLFFGLIKDHPFHDANKRTALLTALFQLQCHNRVVSVAQKELEDVAVAVAENRLTRYRSFRDFQEMNDPEVRFLGRFFRRSTRVIDKRDFRVTYRQLAGILARFGYRFGDIHDNRIEVMQDAEERAGFLGLKRRIVARRVVTIGFRNWGTEVAQRDLRDLRKETGLTHEKGYDTAVLLQGVNPMEVLIAEYSAPLQRLALR